MLSGFAGEEDETGVVSLQAFDVGYETFGGEVGTTGIDGDADGWGEFTGDTGFLRRSNGVSYYPKDIVTAEKYWTFYLELCERETTSCTNTAVVLDSWAAYDRSQLIDWSWGDSYRFGDTSISTT